MVEQQDDITAFVQEHFYKEYLDGLKEFVRIPSLSPLYDPEWQTNKNLEKAVDHLISFGKAQDLQGATFTRLVDEGRSPFLIVDVAASNADSKNQVLLYGHMDKQPFGEGWNTDPCDPVIKDGRLYGRGSSDDGYAFFASILAIKACQAAGKPHPRCTITIEGSEEGEIDDLLYYMKNYKHLLGNPTVVFCLDASSQEFTLVSSSSLRGYFDFELDVQVAENGMHSGIAGGIAPNPLWIAMHVLSRIVDFKTQEVIHPAFIPDIPDHVMKEQEIVAAKLGSQFKHLPMLPGVKSVSRKEQGSPEDILQMLIDNSWKAQFTIKGQTGISSAENAGNVLYKGVKFVCTARLPPSIKAEEIKDRVKADLEKQDEFTYGAKIEATNFDIASGFVAPKLPEEFSAPFHKFTNELYGQDPLFAGLGGSIPFMGVFAEVFPSASFVLTGALLPDGNIHSANENLDLEMCRKFTTVVSKFLSAI